MTLRQLSEGGGRKRPIRWRWVALATWTLGRSLSGCSLNDDFYLVRSTGGSGSPLSMGGASDASSGGTPLASGATDASGGDEANDGIGGTGASTDGMGGDASGGTLPTGDGGNASGGTISSGGSGNSGGTSSGGAYGGTSPSSGGAANGGDTASGGTLSSGGTSAKGGAAGSTFQPLCDDSIVKGTPCSIASVRTCYRTCGPDNIGFKTETCNTATRMYEEQDGCTFPAGQDYSCYAVTRTLPAECPKNTVPRATQACTVPACTPCFGGTGYSPQYQDSTGMQKVGYCVCSDGAWTCASNTSWPCSPTTGCN